MPCRVVGSGMPRSGGERAVSVSRLRNAVAVLVSSAAAMLRRLDAALLCLRVSVTAAVSLLIARAVGPLLWAATPFVFWACTTWVASGREIGRHPHDMSRSAAHRREAGAICAREARLFEHASQTLPIRPRRALEALARTEVDLPSAWTEVVVKAVAGIADTYLFTQRALNQAATMVLSLFVHFEQRDVRQLRGVTGDLTLEWCWSPVRGPDGSSRQPSVNIARYRQWVARAAFKVLAELGAQVDPNTAAGDRIKRGAPDVSARPLTDLELDRVCTHVDAGTAVSRRPLLVALSLAGGSAAEVAAVRARDIDLDVGTVAFLGERARVCALDDWSVRVIDRYLRANPTTPDERLCTRWDTPPARAAHSVSIRLWKVLKEVDFSSRCGVSARSIRLAAARQVFESDGIVAAAQFLGSPTLDNTAEALGYDWRSTVASTVQGSGGDG